MSSYNVRKTTQAEFENNRSYITNSMVEAINTCPRWGIIHSVLGKRFVTGYRQMALEAGSVMHDVFACLNLLHIGLVRKLPDHMHFHGEQLFSKERWETIWAATTKKKQDLTLQDINAFERMALACIASSDFYDDPNDKNRTVNNLEYCSFELIQYWLAALAELPIYIEDEKDPEKAVGMEMSLDAVIEDGVSFSQRCIGLADVVYQNPDTKKISLGEYKTASSMNDAWRLSFNTRHQITLYNALLQAYFGYQERFNTILIGSAIPVRSTSAPVQHFTVDRDQENITDLMDMLKHSTKVRTTYEEFPIKAPMYTHSCNRYFRPCSLMDFCTAAKEDQEAMLTTMETELAASPSEQKALLRNM